MLCTRFLLAALTVAPSVPLSLTPATAQVRSFLSVDDAPDCDGPVTVDPNSLPLDHPAAVRGGQTWYFQAWFRDANPGSTSNFTDGVAVTFE